MTDASHELAPDAPTGSELTEIKARLDAATFLPETSNLGDSTTEANFGGVAVSTEITPVPDSNGDGAVNTGPQFVDPEGIDTTVSTQPPDPSVWNKPVAGADVTGYGTERGEYPTGRLN